MSANYDVAFRFVNNTQWAATLEAWGPNPHGRDNGVMLMLRPQDRAAFMQSANVSYFYCVRHHGIEAGFSTKILVDTPINISEIMPETLPVDYQTITPLAPKQGITVRRYRPLTHYVSGWWVAFHPSIRPLTRLASRITTIMPVTFTSAIVSWRHHPT
ncbi:hypothetical protein BC834DRAFT_2319 [Gloeopeniophorella convolvens]|nr:hypothetical protein BC834DRAFT_2319 [Gloeopeniophorella convolvens]